MNSDAKVKGKAVLIENDVVPTSLALGRPSTRDQVNLENDRCPSKILLKNYSNFKKTGPPTWFMHYQSRSWLDFPTEVVEQLRLGFNQGKPVIEIQIGGIGFHFDLYRMVQINLESGKHRSISWTNINDKSFFPKTFIDEFGQLNNSDVNPDIKVLKITKDSSSENPKLRIEIHIGVGPNSNLNLIPNSEPNSSLLEIIDALDYESRKKGNAHIN